MASEAGKGSRPRPVSVSWKTFDENYERTFGKKTKLRPSPKSKDTSDGK